MKTLFITLLLCALVVLPQVDAHASLLTNGDFSSDFTNNSGSVSQGGAFDNWTRPGNHQFTWDGVNEWAFVTDNDGALSTIQLVEDGRATVGLGTISFDYWIEDNTDTPQLQVQVIGITEFDPADIWELNNWNTGGLQAVTAGNGTDDPTATFLYDETFSGDTGGVWVTETGTGEVDFGTGYDFIAVRIAENGSSDFEDPTSPDVLRVDNVSLTAIPEPGSLLVLLPLIGGCFLRRVRRR